IDGASEVRLNGLPPGTPVIGTLFTHGGVSLSNVDTVVMDGTGIDFVSSYVSNTALSITNAFSVTLDHLSVSIIGSSGQDGVSVELASSSLQLGSLAVEDFVSDSLWLGP